MSMTLLALAAAALQALGEYAQQNPSMFHAAVKSAEPVIREASKQMDDVVTGNDYLKNGWTVMDNGAMYQVYHLPAGKTATGLSQAVYNFFSQYTGTRVSQNNDLQLKGITITCVPESLSNAPGAGAAASGMVRKVAGTDIRLTVVISECENNVSVSYFQEVDDEAIRALKALIGNPVLGIGKLYGIVERHQMPFALNAAIKNYLESENVSTRSYKIASDCCIFCGSCAEICPMGAISEGDLEYIIDTKICIACGACVDSCPTGAIVEGGR